MRRAGDRKHDPLKCCPYTKPNRTKKLSFPFRSLWKRHRTICIAFSLTALITLVFALRFVLSVFYWHNAENREHELKDWMTLGHVAMFYNVPPEGLASALNLPSTHSRPITLRQIAREKNISVDELEDEITEIVSEHDHGEGW